MTKFPDLEFYFIKRNLNCIQNEIQTHVIGDL